jgi:hypothetical protein
MGEVIARTAVELHPRAALTGNDAEAVMLDLAQPLAAGWQFIGFAGKTRRDEPGREGTHQHADEIQGGNNFCNSNQIFLEKGELFHGDQDRISALRTALCVLTSAPIAIRC